MIFKRIDTSGNGSFGYDEFVRCAGEKHCKAGLKQPPSSRESSRTKTVLSRLGDSKSTYGEHETSTELDKRRDELSRLKEIALFA